MLAFKNTTVTKTEIIVQLKAHAKADEIVKGQYWSGGKGCAVGCTIHSGDHAEYEPRFGIPEMLARLEDCIFEGLPNDKAKKWPLQFMEAIKVGADLSTVGWEFQHRLQVNNLKFAKERKFSQDTIDAIEKVIDVLEPMTKGKKADESAARSAESAAWSAARSAARSAAWSAARSAAWSAESAAWSAARSAESAESAARSAAWSAAWSAESAESAARSAESAESAAYEEMADLLLEIIKQH